MLLIFGKLLPSGVWTNCVCCVRRSVRARPARREALLLRCWARSPSQRPTACEIVEILANDSKLISPCLDLPPASVQVEGTDSLELTAIGDRGRLHSISSLARRVESVERSAAVVVGQQPQQPGSPVPPPRNQYVTLRQLSRTSRLEAVGCNMTPL